MPIYEFYCQKCNTIYSFFSKSVNTEKVPFCPQCKTIKLKRQMSVFSTISGREESEDEIDEDDPRQAATLMRKLSEATGLSLSSGMEEALSRLESGEDPDKIEEEMGDLLEGEDPLILGSKGRKGTRQSKPQVDDKLYDL